MNWVTPVVRVTVVLVAAAAAAVVVVVVVVVVVAAAAAAVMFTFFLQEGFWGIQKVTLVEFMFIEQAWSYVAALRTWDCLYSSKFHQKR